LNKSSYRTAGRSAPPYWKELMIQCLDTPHPFLLRLAKRPQFEINMSERLIRGRMAWA
jgi:hypothetical protein